MELFIARQPIFDATRDVLGYELLFRDGLSNCFSAADGNEATRQVLLNTFVLFGLSRLTGGRPAFINFTREYLFNDLIRLFPPHSVVVEILETVAPDRDVIEACKKIKDAGYTLALDDVTTLEPYADMLDLVGIVKVDFRKTPADVRRNMAKRIQGTNVRLLAEKVETYEEFREAVHEGFALFQGYFFAKPELVKKRDVPGNRAQYMRLLREIRKPNLTVDNLDSIVKQDISLSYRLLKYVNSPLFGLRSEIRSVRHALTLLGERDVRRWATLALLQGLSTDKPTELLETGLLRARFCETLSAVLGPDAQDAAEEMFLVGLFSVLDALLDVPMDEAVRDAAVPGRVKSALLGVDSPLLAVLKVVIAYNQGDWNYVSGALAAFGVDTGAAAQAFVDSLDWARQAAQTQNESPWSSRPPPVPCQ